MSESGSRQIYEKFETYIRPDQREFIDQDGRGRYPDLASKGPHGRHLSPAHRDMLDYCKATYSSFLVWLATRG